MRENITPHNATVTRERREKQNGHKSLILWFTGLSGAGKSSLAHAVEEKLYQYGIQSYVLDGDNIRHGLCGDLSFTDADRKENIRRIVEISKIMLDAGIITLTAFISPFREDRELARKTFKPDEFIEIYCECPIKICEQRDVKGLYKKARNGDIPNFTGISSPYEIPRNPELIINTHGNTIDQCVAKILQLSALKKIC